VEEHAMVPPAVAARDELILPSEQRMVRVRDSDGLTRNAGVRCSRMCSPRAASSGRYRCGRPPPERPEPGCGAIQHSGRKPPYCPIAKDTR
jgi:hypothetical protein